MLGMTAMESIVYGSGILGVSILVFLVLRLRRSEERFRLLAENTSDLVGLHTPKGEHIWLSPSHEQVLGYSLKEMLGHSAYEYIHPEDHDFIRRDSHSPVVQGKDKAGVVSTYRAKLKDGTYIWLETLTQAILDKKGQVIRLQTISRDVTVRKNAEEMYRFLVRHLPGTTVFVFDRHYRHLVADGTITGATIPPSGSLEGATIWEVFPKDIARILEPYYRGVFDGQNLRTEQSFRTRTYRITFLPVYRSLGVKGAVDLGMAVFHDVTEEKLNLRNIEEKTADLERSNRDLEQFANIASHELKSPLRRISSFAELLAEEYEGLLSDTADDYIHEIVNGVGALNEVIEALLTYSRVQSDKSHMDWTDMNNVVDDAVRQVGQSVRESNALVTRDPLPEMVTGDSVLLRQVFENLIGNAIKYNTTGRQPMVHISSERRLLDWEFTVHDNGPGVEPEHYERIFQMFKRSRIDVEGTGIGLALCKKIVGLHRGKIWVESVVGEGSQFRFSLPARSPEEVTQ